MKLTSSLVAGLGLICLLVVAGLVAQSHWMSTPTDAPIQSAEEARSAQLVEPVVASLSDLRPIASTRPVGDSESNELRYAPKRRPNREGEGGSRSRAESSFTEAEILAMIAEAERLPPDPNVQVLGEARGGLDFSAGTRFDSIEVTECCDSGTLNPPDPEVAVGRNHIIAVVNAAIEIYDKSGNSVFGPLDFESFFSVLGLGCTIFPFDPNAIYDESEDRYIVAADGNGSEYCVAVSQTGDATGMYNFYAFPVNVGGAFFDYPHAGVGVDAIYVGANMFGGGTGRVFAFEKAAMYAGTPAASATQDLGADSTPQPMNIKGIFPTTGPHYILTSRSGAGDFQLYSWDDPFGADILSSITTLDVPAVHGVAVGFGIGSPQLGGGSINSIGPRPQDFEYRDGFAWMTNLVSCNPGGGTVNCVQWAQIDVANAAVAQAGVFATDGEYRIFSDLAVDACGNMAVGYTKTDATISPSVWIAGRSASDPPGTVQGEVEIKAGETAFGESRWGDYTGMTADPDGRTLWYLGEYAKNTASSRNWGTFVGSVRFNNCDADIFADGFESGDTSSWTNTNP